ncbi:MAG: hypothetical protein LUD41_03910, partial [Phascolarctobacterium sp.]|nr:hypothetical protein [Phascolarctobacterium sp.]
YKRVYTNLFVLDMGYTLFFSEETAAIEEMEDLAAQTQANITEMVDSADDDSVISELSEDGQLKAADVAKKMEDIIKELTTPEIKALEDMLSEWPKISKKPLYTEYVEKHPLCKCALNNNGATSKKAISDKIEELQASLSIPEEYADDYAQLTEIQEMMDRVDNYSKTVKALRKTLDDRCRKHYETLSDEEIIDLLVNKKWVNTIANGINELYTAIPHHLAERILVLVERYERTMPDLLKDVDDYEAKVKSHLERMGFKW